jgi:hypothetical protein
MSIDLLSTFLSGLPYINHPNKKIGTIKANSTILPLTIAVTSELAFAIRKPPIIKHKATPRPTLPQTM